jgi:selenocysteine-specific elongation factor
VRTSDAVTAATGVRVVGTAGHVDHGKSSLITALTGIDPDRLSEERERGMTIDLGFAWMTTPSGMEIGFVDVPGHQDFIRNMLAGVGSIDAVLLVVAADEGVRPQTREHLAILGILGIERGVVALTKRDLVDDTWAALARDELAGTLAETPLASARIVEVSAKTRDGLDALTRALEEMLASAPQRRITGRPRLPVDRAFTMAGFGTVVTGTLIEGDLTVGEEIELVPGQARARIRGLQTHRRAIDAAVAGSRVAANLSGIDKDAIQRGMVVTRPGTLRPTNALALRLAMLPAATVEQDEEVKVHVGTAEVMARVSVLEKDAINAGESAWVHLRLAEPVAAAVGDRLVVRRPSPSETVGGGVITDISPARARRRDAVLALERRSAPTPMVRLLASLDTPRTAIEAAERSGLDAKERDAAVQDGVKSGDIVALGDALISRPAFETLATHVLRLCAQTHRKQPLRAGASREEVRSAVGLAPKRFVALVDRLVADGRLADRGAALALPDHRPRLTPDQERNWERARAAIARDPTHPPSPEQLQREHGLDRELVAALGERGDIVRIGTEAVFLPETVLRFADAVLDELGTAKTITVSRARDLTGSSRKHVLPLLGYLDDHGITRRQGDDRILVLAPDAARSRIRSLIQHREASS